jgi:hypothetical protein
MLTKFSYTSFKRGFRSFVLTLKEILAPCRAVVILWAFSLFFSFLCLSVPTLQTAVVLWTFGVVITVHSGALQQRRTKA